MTGKSNMRAYSSARRISSLFCTQWPSSVIATTPACFSEPMGASSSPLMPLVIAPVTYTFTTPSRAAFSFTSATAAGLSMLGEVFGMQTTVVNPPRAAAFVPVAMVSLADWPGSRRCTCRSIKPGVTTLPEASRRSQSLPACFAASAPMAATLPSRRRTSATASKRLAGSMTRPPEIRRELIRGGDYRHAQSRKETTVTVAVMRAQGIRRFRRLHRWERRVNCYRVTFRPCATYAGTMNSRQLLVWGASALLISATAFAEPKLVHESPKSTALRDSNVGRLVPEISLASIDGKTFRLGDGKSPRATVIAFLSTSCPLSKRFAPTLATLEKEFATRDVRFIFVNPIRSDTADEMAHAARTHGFKGAMVRDTDGKITATLAARSTTEVFVFDAARTLIYRGAVDDQYGLAYSLEAPRHRYLVDALENVLNGKPLAMRATTSPGCALEPNAKLAAASPVTYHARVSRIVQQNCLECHRTGGVAPFALETYEQVTSHAGMIRKMVDRGAMPPWFAAPTPAGHTSAWFNDRTLPADDKRDLLAWLAGDKAEGNSADAPLARVFPKEWQIGTPDTVVQIPQPIAVKATGKMPYQNVYVETSFAEDRWVRALEVRPTAREVVHHVLVFVLPKQTNSTAAATNSSTRKRR